MPTEDVFFFIINIIQKYVKHIIRIGEYVFHIVLPFAKAPFSHRAGNEGERMCLMG